MKRVRLLNGELDRLLELLAKLWIRPWLVVLRLRQGLLLGNLICLHIAWKKIFLFCFKFGCLKINQKNYKSRQMLQTQTKQLYNFQRQVYLLDRQTNFLRVNKKINNKSAHKITMNEEQSQLPSQVRLKEQLSSKIVINETILLKKIQLIRKYYTQAKKALVFFNSQQFDTKLIQKQIFQLFFSTKNYQGSKQTSFEGFNYIIYESNFKAICKKKSQKVNSSQLFDLNMQGVQQQLKQSEDDNGFHEYHYFGELLSSSPIYQNQQSTERTENQAVLHGYGLLINFQPFQNTDNQNHSFLINCYFGQFINGLKHGYGMEFNQNKNSKDTLEIYIGSFINGSYDDDEGIWIKIRLLDTKDSPEDQNQNLTLQYVDKYFGGFVNGKKHGKGKISSFELYYDGDWRFDKPEGNGQLWTSSSYYKGKFKSGLKHSSGKQIFKNGDIYEGSYSNNKPGGNGKYFWKNGSFYEGQFKNGLRDGKGLWKFGLQSHEGTYTNDKKSGEGIYYWSDGQTYYKGGFYEDLRHGYGQMYWDNRTSIYKGKWKYGFQDGYGEVFQMSQGSDNSKLVKKGQFSKGQMIEQIVEENQQSIQATEEDNITLEDTVGFSRNIQSEQKTKRTPKQIEPVGKYSKPILRKLDHKKKMNHIDQTDQQFEQTGRPTASKQFLEERRKMMVKSQNKSKVNQSSNIQLEKIHKEKNRYGLNASKDPIEKEHLYGSVYLVKSDKKKVVSSLLNIPRASTQKIQRTQKVSDHRLPIPNNKYTSNKNDRIQSFTGLNPKNKIKPKQKKQNIKIERLQKIQPKYISNNALSKQNSIHKQMDFNKHSSSKSRRDINFQRKFASSSFNQEKEVNLRYFDPDEEQNFKQLEPLIVWNNFFKPSDRRSSK